MAREEINYCMFQSRFQLVALCQTFWLQSVGQKLSWVHHDPILFIPLQKLWPHFHSSKILLQLPVILLLLIVKPPAASGRLFQTSFAQLRGCWTGTRPQKRQNRTMSFNTSRLVNYMSICTSSHHVKLRIFPSSISGWERRFRLALPGTLQLSGRECLTATASTRRT